MTTLMSLCVLLLVYGSDGLQLGSAKGSACQAKNPNGQGYVDGVCMHAIQCTQALKGLIRLQFPAICGTYLLVPLVCCPKMDQFRRGFFNPTGLGSFGTGSSYPFGQGAMNQGQPGFNPLGIVDSFFKIPGTGGNFGVDIPNIVNPVPGIPQIPTFGDFSSFWNQIPPIPTGPFGADCPDGFNPSWPKFPDSPGSMPGPFFPPMFGGGMQPAGPGYGNRGPQLPSGGGIMPYIPGTVGAGGNRGPQLPSGGGVMPQVPGTAGGGGNQGPTYPQQPNPVPGTGPHIPPVHQGTNEPPASPHVPSRPDVPIGVGPVKPEPRPNEPEPSDEEGGDGDSYIHLIDPRKGSTEKPQRRV